MKYLSELLEQSIALELNVSALYLLYSQLFDDDREFWWQISIEEQNHAALLKSARAYLTLGMLPAEVVHENIDILKSVNETITTRTKTFKANHPDRQQAYSFARALENSAAELHYQKLMTRSSEDRIVNILKQLGKDDIDHAERINALMSKRGL